MNYPTANFIPLSKYQVIPEGGVYLSRVFIDGEYYFGMTNIGYRPTFNEKKLPNSLKMIPITTPGSRFIK